ncbi:MAG TPA: NAD(P)H-dependent oxidoreductase [Planctomycetota bacterium]|jgi:chromate reductase|nr:NAD(P)H-dependent oxidoreductase [Planctomycetota bacterium]
MTTPRILALAGSLRKESFNKKLIRIAVEGARAAGADVRLIDLRDFPMPIYDAEIEAAGLPEPALRLKTLFLEHQGLLIASPEYNRSVPGVLKNAIDWVSRSAPGESPLACFTDKIAGLLSASPGAAGGMRGLMHLREILAHIKVLVIPEQVTVPKANDAFNPDGSLKDPKQHSAVAHVATKLTETIAKLRA